jgi:pyruvate kinase
MALPDHKTKIICTIGPASESPAVMERLLRAGMDIARLNFSHGAFDRHRQVIADLRQAAATVGRRLTIMADLPGPKMRIGMLSREPVTLEPGAEFCLTTEAIVGDQNRAAVTLANLPEVVHRGDILFLNDGLIQLEVIRIEPPAVVCRVVVGGELRSRKGLNIPGIDLGICAFTPRDRECLAFAVENGVDAVSQSFVESASDIEAVRRAAAAVGPVPFIIAKIERSRALEHIEQIIVAADGVMIARGDLGVEVPIERIAVVQKQIMRLANRHGRPVITATQMLESMISNSRPTRAESTDVANAILDGTDCVMLSGESAMGQYPVQSVAMLAGIAAAVEPQRPPLTVRDLHGKATLARDLDPAQLLAIAVEEILAYAAPVAVFVPTRSGSMARSISRYRLPVWTVALSRLETTCQALAFSSGVYAVHEEEHPENWRAYVKQWLARHDVQGGLVVVTEGPSSKHPDTNHRVEILDLRQ